MDDSTVLFYACKLCLRLYTLKEDLRGHMIEYHKWIPIGSKKSRSKEFSPNQENGTEVTDSGADKLGLIAIKDEENSLNTELRPMPFKSFRIFLRSRLSLRCPTSTACVYKFESVHQQDQHSKCHIGPAADEGFKCFQCNLNMLNWRQCSAHLWKAHEIDVDLLHCPICSEFKAHTTVHVWRHMRIHKKWRPLVMRTLRAVQKRRQQRESNGVGSAATASQTATNPNKNRYYAEKTCEICNRKFVNGKTLSKHVKTVHNKIKPFICNICGMKTARKASLVIHMRQHTGEKPLQCKSCNFSTRDPSVLKKHQQRHNKTGLFKCNYCSYVCIQTISLKRHIRLKHPEEFKRISCDLCSFLSTNNETLLMHKEDHRRGLILNADDATRCDMKAPLKLHDKNNEMSADCFLPLESIDSLPHDPPVDTGGVTIPAPPSEDTQFPTYLNN